MQDPSYRILGAAKSTCQSSADDIDGVLRYFSVEAGNEKDFNKVDLQLAQEHIEREQPAGYGVPSRAVFRRPDCTQPRDCLADAGLPV